MTSRVYVDLVGEHALNTTHSQDKAVPKYLVAFHPNGKIAAMLGDLDAAESELENRVAQGKGRWEYHVPDPEAPVPTWQDRVRAEEADLSEKLDNLRAFTEDDSFGVIELEDRVLLLVQLSHMMQYRDTLKQRIARFTPLT